MTKQRIKEYYDTTKNRKIRPDLSLAISIVRVPKIAIDCGCGAGADIQHLLSLGFKVYAFDIEDESISRCQSRFKNHNDVILSKSEFKAYTYPKSSLVIADASLFFCPINDFEIVWNKIYQCLYPDGVFCGSFLGPEDTMAGADYNRLAFWPDTSVFEESQVRSLFDNYKICRFTEHKSTGISPLGVSQDWHIFSVVAKKLHI